ncbi:MAG: hypothetical protein EOO47_26555 [Flavobacterium sp.]|nr:MAG: hypothetical protein EOO47_26555 [Flavobacterium sp.]
MIVELNSEKKLLGFRSKGFDRSVVKEMVVAYRKKPEAKDSLKYAHFNVYEVLELFMVNNVLSPTLIKAITAEEANIKKFGLKIYLASHCFDLTDPLPGSINADDYKDKTTTVLCNTKIGHGFRDLLDDQSSISIATSSNIEQGQGLDQAEICPPYNNDDDDDYDIGYEANP